MQPSKGYVSHVCVPSGSMECYARTKINTFNTMMGLQAGSSDIRCQPIDGLVSDIGGPGLEPHHRVKRDDFGFCVALHIITRSLVQC
jgi:hypothetical protein